MGNHPNVRTSLAAELKELTRSLARLTQIPGFLTQAWSLDAAISMLDSLSWPGWPVGASNEQDLTTYSSRLATQISDFRFHSLRPLR